MMSIETFMDAINRKRIVKMKSCEDELHAWGEWTSKMASADDPALDEYCADVIKAVQTLYSDQTDARDHEIQLENSAIDGITRVHVDWGDMDKTLKMVNDLLADMRRGVLEKFHPEIDADRQQWCREQAANNSDIDTYVYDPVTRTAVKKHYAV